MKKKAFAILTLCISLFAAVAGGLWRKRWRYRQWRWRGAEKASRGYARTDFIWFKVEVPRASRSPTSQAIPPTGPSLFTESEHASDRFIPVFDPDKNADELFDYEAKWNASFEWTGE
ncbi:MAG: hypothetical protein ACLU37_08950 [Collinsella sp.]